MPHDPRPGGDDARRAAPPRRLGLDARAEVDDELAFHGEQRARDYERRGLTPDAARAAALARLGDVQAVRRECAALLAEERRAERRRDWFGDLAQDVRFGLRTALRAPLFSLLAVVTLALGIGANAAVFGVVKSVLLDALPYRDADRLVRVYGRFLDGSHERGPLSAGTVHDVIERQRSFESVAYFNGVVDDVVVGGEDGPRVGTRAWVDPSLFRTLGVTPALGRAFLADDVGDTARVVVLSHAAWQRQFAGDPAAIGRDVRVNGIPRTVIGVLPRDFVGPMGEADYFFALPLDVWLRDPVAARGSHFLGAVARLRSGVTPEAGERELVAISEALAREYPDDNRSIRLHAPPLRDAMVGDTRTPLLVLLASAGLVLLVACANLAGALLSRTLSRRREFAVRVAMGAGRGRLARQLLTESTLLALVGGAVGLLLARLGLAVLRGLALPALPPYAELALDPGAVAVTAVVALATGLLFGVAPALAAGRANVQGTLREESRGTSEGRRTRHLRGLLVAGQIALCVSLLAGAGLLARSLWAMTSAPLGVRPHGVLTMSVKLPTQLAATPEKLVQLQQEYADRLRALPGVRSVANASALPTAVLSRNGVAIEGAPRAAGDAVPFVLWSAVSDDYFATLGVPLLAGRVFDARDHLQAPPTIVISESMARRFWPDGDALGARLRLGPDPKSPLITVVGIVGDVRNDPTRPDAEAITYAPARQAPWNASSFLVRTDGDPLALAAAARRELAAIDPGLPIDRVMTLDALLADALSGRKLPVLLMVAFGALALLLASVGVYAMFAAMAAAREREFGVRVALGSSRSAIAALVLRQGGVWMALGLAAGALGVVAVARTLRSLLYGVAPFDPVALGLAVAALVACGVLALLVPVRRATRADPIAVLR